MGSTLSATHINNTVVTVVGKETVRPAHTHMNTRCYLSNISLHIICIVLLSVPIVLRFCPFIRPWHVRGVVILCVCVCVCAVVKVTLWGRVGSGLTRIINQACAAIKAGILLRRLPRESSINCDCSALNAYPYCTVTSPSSHCWL